MNRYPASAAEWRALHLPGNPGRLARDPEVRVLVDELLPRMTFAAIAAECRRRFGPDRAPSKSAIGRYWLHLTAARGTLEN